jgi:hypothetical protein
MYMISKILQLHTCDHHTDLCLKVFVVGIAFEKNVHITDHWKGWNVTLSREDDER